MPLLDNLMLQEEKNNYIRNTTGYLEDQEPWDRTRGLKFRCRFRLLKAEGVLIWNSPELLSFDSVGDSVTLREFESSLLHNKD